MSGSATKIEDGQRDRDFDTRTRLLEAAGPIFAKHGFDRATVREICAAASVNIASVGYYFGDKLGLYREVIQAIRDARERQFPAPDNRGQEPQQHLLLIVRTLLSRMLAADAASWETQLLLREMHHPTPVFDSIVRDCFRPMFDDLVQTIRQLFGGSPSNQSVQQLALSVIGQCLYYRVGAGVVQVLIPESERQQHYDIESLSRHITAVTLAATQQGCLVDQRLELDRRLGTAVAESDNVNS